MSLAKVLTFVADIFPLFLDWLRVVFDSTDEEFEKISSAWPRPTKTKLARLRAEKKAEEHFTDN